MASSAATTASVPLAQMDNRQARLDAAIALFRSEASASGYVVEEVRLRLPVPDVDVMPRVIIAQQSSAANTPPTFPRAKHPRPISSYPGAPTSDHVVSPIREQAYPNSPKLAYGANRKLTASSDIKISVPSSGKAAGFKRTVSGSVIFHPIPARPLSLQKESTQPGMQSSQPPKKMGPLSSIPYLPTKDSPTSQLKNRAPSGIRNGQFWKTVIGGEKGRAILKAAESMHRMRHGAQSQKFVPPVADERQSPMEVTDSPRQRQDEEREPNTDAESPRKRAKEADASDDEETGENTLHINGHNIPESHVQLLLSSAADISARERVSSSKKNHEPRLDQRDQGDNKKAAAAPQAMVNGKPSGTKATPVSDGKQYASRGRRDASERQTSRSSAARPFKCHKCPSSFDRDGHLRVHILAVHEKKRPFVCQVCDASFGHSSSLLRHVRTVHQASPAIGSGKPNAASRAAQKNNDSGTTKSEDICDDMEDDSEKHFRCSACGQAFNRVALLNRHVANKHPLRSSSPGKSDDPKNSP